MASTGPELVARAPCKRFPSLRHWPLPGPLAGGASPSRRRAGRQARSGAAAGSGAPGGRGWGGHSWGRELSAQRGSLPSQSDQGQDRQTPSTADHSSPLTTPRPTQPGQGHHTLPALQGGAGPDGSFSHDFSKRCGDLSRQSTAPSLWDGDGALLAPKALRSLPP